MKYSPQSTPLRQKRKSNLVSSESFNCLAREYNLSGETITFRNWYPSSNNSASGTMDNTLFFSSSFVISVILYEILQGVFCSHYCICFDFFLQLHDAVQQRLRPWRTSGYIYVNGDNMISAPYHGIAVVIKRTAGDGACAHRNYVFGICKL